MCIHKQRTLWSTKYAHTNGDHLHNPANNYNNRAVKLLQWDSFYVLDILPALRITFDKIILRRR